MQIAFYKAIEGNLLDMIIGLCSFSKYSHVEFVFSDGICGSSSKRDNGVRLKKIDLKSGHWDVFDLKIDISEESLRNWFEQNSGSKYDVFGGICSIFRINFNIDYHIWFCSEILGIFTLGQNNLNPGALYKQLLKNKLI